MKDKEKQIEDIGEYIAEVSHLECGIKCCEECKWCGSANLQKADCTDYLIAEKLIKRANARLPRLRGRFLRKLKQVFISNLSMGKLT